MSPLKKYCCCLKTIPFLLLLSFSQSLGALIYYSLLVDTPSYYDFHIKRKGILLYITMFIHLTKIPFMSISSKSLTHHNYGAGHDS